MTTPFLWTPGTGNNGLLTTNPVKLIQPSAIAAGNTYVSVGGGADDSTSGFFNNSNFGQGIWAEIVAILDAITSPGAGANIAGWFLKSWDGSTTESTSVAPPRSPDFIIPLPAATTGAGQQFCVTGLVLIPAVKFKVMIQNNAANALATNTTTQLIRAVPVAMAA